MKWLAILLLASVANAETVREIEVAKFAGGEGSRFFVETARKYEQLRPGVKVNLYADPRIADKVRIRIIEGKYPNATDAWDLPWYKVVQSGKVLDLAPYLDKPNWEGDARWRDTFLPGALDRWTEGARVWAIPFEYAAELVFYNRKLFREHGWGEPRTWDEMLALCEKIKATGIAPFAFPGVYPSYGRMILESAYFNLVGPQEFARYQQLEPDTRTDPRHVRAAALLRQLSTDYFEKGWQGMSHTAAQLQFFQGSTAMMVNGSWLVSEMSDKIPGDFELGAFTLPHFKDGVGDPTAIRISSGYYFLFADTPNIDVAVDFFRYLTSRERATAFAKMQDYPTSIRGVPLGVYSARMQDAMHVIQSAQAAYGDPPGSVNFPGMGQAFNNALFNLLNGKFTAEEYSRFLENAATTERARAANPDRVIYRHRLAGGLLLSVIALTVLLVVVRQFTAGARRTKPVVSQPRLHWRHVVLFVGPAALMYVVFTLKPSTESFGWALVNWDGLTTSRFVGLLNFKRLLFESDEFWIALRNNLFVMFVPSAFIIPLSLLFAYLISRGVWGSKVFRVCFFFPNILGFIATTLLWMNAYDPKGGLVNGALVALGFKQFESFAWLSQDHLYWALVPMLVWGSCGFNMILFLAAMENVDTSLYEAAEIDGASPAQQFFRITLPMIWDILTVAAVFMVIGGLKTFEQIWLLTSQQPTSDTHVIGTLMVSKMFQEFRVGEATAIAVVLFVLVFFGTLATMRLMKREAVEV